MEFLEAVRNRRSMYSISSEEAVSEVKVESIVESALLHTPSPYNIQQGRIILLFGSHHHRLWEIVMDTLRARIPAEKFGRTQTKVDSFRAGYGTVLFFNDNAAIQSLSTRFPRFADTFPIWAHHSQGMLQYVVWTALESEGLGASLQHYNPLIDEKVRAEWVVPEGWQLIAQMPFGKPTSPAGEKDFLPLDIRLRVFRD